MPPNQARRIADQNLQAKHISGARGREGELVQKTGLMFILLQNLVGNPSCLLPSSTTPYSTARLANPRGPCHLDSRLIVSSPYKRRSLSLSFSRQLRHSVLPDKAAVPCFVTFIVVFVINFLGKPARPLTRSLACLTFPGALTSPRRSPSLAPQAQQPPPRMNVRVGPLSPFIHLHRKKDFPRIHIRD